MSQKSAKKFRTDLVDKSSAQLNTNEDRIQHILKYGTLAPSTHNTQPWLIEIRERSVSINADFNKRIPVADPKGRDLFISLGAFTKNIEMAAQSFGVKYELKIKEDLHKGSVAEIVFKNLKDFKLKERSLLESIAARQNYRGLFKKTCDKKLINNITSTPANNYASLKPIYDRGSIETMAQLTAEGLKKAYAKPAFRKEIASFIRHNHSSERTGLHGYSLRMNMPTSIIVPRIMKKKDIGPKLAVKNYESFVSAPCVAVLQSQDDERDWFEAGRILEEVLISLTKKDYSASIYAAAIEDKSLRSKISTILPRLKKQKPQLLVCIGKPSDTMGYSVRKDLEDIIV